MSCPCFFLSGLKQPNLCLQPGGGNPTVLYHFSQKSNVAINFPAEMTSPEIMSRKWLQSSLEIEKQGIFFFLSLFSLVISLI